MTAGDRHHLAPIQGVLALDEEILIGHIRAMSQEDRDHMLRLAALRAERQLHIRKPPRLMLVTPGPAINGGLA